MKKRISTALCGLFLGLFVVAAGTLSAHAALVITSLKDNSGAAYPAGAFGPVNGSDLANQGQVTFLNSSGSGFQSGDTEALLNEGLTGTAGLSNTGFQAGMFEDTSFTFTFDLSTNTLGYDITQIDSIAGWSTNSLGRSNQGYRVTAFFVGGGSSIIVPQQTFESNTPPALWTKVSLSDTSGTLATGVQALTFDRFVPANSGGPAVYHEVDVTGVATFVPEPSRALLSLVGIAAIGLRRRRN